MNLKSAALWLIAVAVLSGPALAQDVEPLRTTEAATALAAAQWVELEPGLAVKRASAGVGVMITALRIDQDKFKLAAAVQDNPDGQTAESFAQDASAVLAVNGGFFGEKAEGRDLYSVGLLRIGGKTRSANWKTTGGYLIFAKDRLAIEPASTEPPAGAPDLLQSKPLMIEPGGKWAMNTNQGPPRPRTAVCTFRDDATVLVLLVSGVGLTLYETGWLLRQKQEGGLFGCDAALALDGGGSTQLWVKDRGDLAVEGETAVHNALIVLRR
ncbi:MAG TPA: phosphodiester glycosidase family protein [Rhizobiaceae bacterium]|nr:phosphodiester glycosidase family protein [Rhizobiaceae bacterium]